MPRNAAPRELAVALHDLAWLLPRTISRAAARDDGLPPSELEVMRLLVRRPGLSVREVASEVGLRPSNASAAVRTLIARGLLERARDERDRRVARLVPTRRALRARERHEAAWGDAMTDVLDVLGADDVRRLEAAAPALAALARELAGYHP